MPKKIQIDPKVTEGDAASLKWTPAEREEHLRNSGHNGFFVEGQFTDEAKIAWFESYGEIGKERLRLARQLLAQEEK